MVKYSNLVEKLKTVNNNQWLAHTLYLYRDVSYYTVYKIMELYKNYTSRFQKVIQNKFNKAMS